MPMSSQRAPRRVRAWCARLACPAGAAVLTALVVVTAGVADAVQVDAVDLGREWRVAALVFRGNRALRTSELRNAMITKARPWYEFWQIWRPLAVFDPVAFRSDIDRLRQLYRNNGYYQARVFHDIELPTKGNDLRIVVYVEEGAAVYVEAVSVSLRGEPLPDDARERLLTQLPIKRDDRFTQAAYERAYSDLRTYYREHGFARVTVRRSAQVDVPRGTVSVRYEVDSGPTCVFGAVHIEGARDPDVVRREVPFEPGQPFKQSVIERTRGNLVALRIFSSVRVDEDKTNDPTVDVRIRVAAGASREVRLGVGYDTEEQIRVLAAWRDYNFFGGARQLGFTARASFLRRTIAADFLQPHFPGPNDRVRLLLSEEQEDEDPYTNDRSRLAPRIEWQALPNVTPYASYRVEYDSLSNVNPVIARVFPDIVPRNGILSGLAFGVDWNATDDLIDPSRGWAGSAAVEPVGSFLGGKFGFLRLTAEGRRYQPLVHGFLGALRLRLGAADPMGGSDDIPVFERFYAGGINSVRGYERRHVGPLACDFDKNPLGAVDAAACRARGHNDPIGGRTLVEGSAELRHPITEKIGGAVFLDGGQVSLHTFDFPFDDLRYGTGVGVRYKSPVGPLRLDLGFPIQRPAGDASWQVHVSIGQTF